jgi:hypothetical protein
LADAAAATTPSRSSSSALVQSFDRLREQVKEFLSDDALRLKEFDAAFPAIGSAPLPNEVGPARQIQAAGTSLARAEQAAILLRQIGGWLDGLIQELTYDERLRLEAQEVAKLRVKT